MNELKAGRWWQHRSIFSELMVLVIIFAVGLSWMIGSYALKQFHNASERQYLEALESLADQKSELINRYISSHLGRVETLGMLPLTQQAIPAFLPAFFQDGVDSKAYRAVNDKFDDFFKRYRDHWGYYDLFLIDTGGNIVYSITHESDFATNLNDGPYQGSGLAKVFHQACQMLQSNSSSLEYYAPSNATAGFVATPVLKDGVLVGVIALQFDYHELYDVINNYTGLGTTGEVVVGRVQADHVIVTAPLRHDSDAAFKRRIAMNVDNALPIRESSSGIAGQGILNDWRDKEVLAVWQYLPALQWGMVVKIDVEEAFVYWYELRSTMIVYLIFAVLLTCLALFFMIRRIVEPIRQLTYASHDVALDGEHVDVSSLLKYHNEVGVLARAFGDMALRVTQSKNKLQQAADALLENNRLLDERVAHQTEYVRAAVDGSSDGIIILNEQCIIERVNPALMQMFEYAEKELLGMHILSLMPEGYRDKKLLNIDDSHVNLMSNPVKTEWKGEKKSGDIFAIDFQLNAMFVVGKPMFLVTLRDVTERKRLEEDQQRMAMAVEQAQDSILITDLDGTIEYANPAYQVLSGYKLSELVGKNTRIAKSGKMSDLFYKKMWGKLLNGDTWQAEFINKAKDGSFYDVSQAITPILDQRHEMIGFVAVQRDIGKEKQEREKLEHTQRLESLGVLAGGIAHDFNNLLTAILGNASLAKGYVDSSSRATEMLNNIEQASERAAALCKQMLAYSGKGKFVVRDVNLSTMIREMLNLLNVSIPKNVAVRLDLSDSVCAVEADVAQMQQVVMNLVINAAEAIDQNNGTLTIHTSEIEANEAYIQGLYLNHDMEAGRFVVLEVSDTGCGMSDETKKHLFDPFFTTKFTGRGLGMSAILGIVRGHKGAIKVYSEIGKGTTLKLLFPCSGSLDKDVDQKALVVDEVMQGKGTILIVDDEETICKTAAMILQRVGFSTLTAKDGMEGVEVFQKHQHEIVAVLLDMTMPRMGGEEAFRSLRAVKSDVKVILSSGYNEQDATNRFVGKGLAGFIQKPYMAKQLQDLVLTLLTSESTQDKK